jgi:hypothetical protein
VAPRVSAARLKVCKGNRLGEIQKGIGRHLVFIFYTVSCNSKCEGRDVGVQGAMRAESCGGRNRGSSRAVRVGFEATKGGGWAIPAVSLAVKTKPTHGGQRLLQPYQLPYTRRQQGLSRP